MNAKRAGREPEQPKFCDGQIKIPYAWPAGRTGSRFLRALRDEKKLWGLRCPDCRRVRVPPGRCLDCDRIGAEWVEVGPTGTLEGWTVVRYHKPQIQVLSVPYAVGLIRLRGADTALVHLLGETDLDALRTGLPVEPVFSEKPRGHILDVRYFRPVPGGGG